MYGYNSTDKSLSDNKLTDNTFTDRKLNEDDFPGREFRLDEFVPSKNESDIYSKTDISPRFSTVRSNLFGSSPKLDHNNLFGDFNRESFYYKLPTQ